MAQRDKARIEGEMSRMEMATLIGIPNKDRLKPGLQRVTRKGPGTGIADEGLGVA